MINFFKCIGFSLIGTIIAQVATIIVGTIIIYIITLFAMLFISMNAIDYIVNLVNNTIIPFHKNNLQIFSIVYLILNLIFWFGPGKRYIT